MLAVHQHFAIIRKYSKGTTKGIHPITLSSLLSGLLNTSIESLMCEVEVFTTHT